MVKSSGYKSVNYTLKSCGYKVNWKQEVNIGIKPYCLFGFVAIVESINLS
jgi:hypothetical protein